MDKQLGHENESINFASETLALKVNVRNRVRKQFTLWSINASNSEVEPKGFDRTVQEMRELQRREILTFIPILLLFIYKQLKLYFLLIIKENLNFIYSTSKFNNFFNFNSYLNTLSIPRYRTNLGR